MDETMSERAERLAKECQTRPMGDVWYAIVDWHWAPKGDDALAKAAIVDRSFEEIASTLRALAAENAALLTERDAATTRAVTCEAMIAARGTNRDYQEARAVKTEAERDAAIRERDEALRRRDIEMASAQISASLLQPLTVQRDAANAARLAAEGERDRFVSLLRRAQEELRLIRMKDTGALYDVGLRTAMAAALLTPAPEAPNDGE